MFAKKKRLIHCRIWSFIFFNILGLQWYISSAEKKTNHGVVYLWTSAFLSVLVASLSEYYEANLEFDNKVPSLEPMNSKYADSSVRCAMLCGSGCKCFNFNEHTRLCLSYSLCNALDKTVNKIGWRLYVKQSLSSNGEYEVFAYNISYSISMIVLWLCLT